MSYVPKAGMGLIFMKVGTHAKETLEDILVRKQKELADAGVSFWGYGGGTCHPTTKVQPFVSRLAEQGQQVYLCMQQMTSNHFADPVRAEEYSDDGISWKAVPKPINVLGSRFALVVKSLDVTDFDLSLAHTRVGIGLQQGRIGLDYVRGHVDKACLVLTDEAGASAEGDKVLKISLAAQLAHPYAVLLR